MDTAEVTERGASCVVRNLGGIDETTVEVPPGVSVLTGRNATNRTSLLRAVMAALGSDDVSLKGDADAGRVELTVDGETYTRTLERTDGRVVTGGDPYLDDPTVADLFAFLLETNEARQAVAREADLRDVIMRPVDTDAIQAEIRETEAERNRVDERLEELASLRDDLPELERRRSELEADIDEQRTALEEKEEEIEAHEADVDDGRETRDELESTLDDLRDRRGSLEEVRSDIDLQQTSIEALTEERTEVDGELAELPAPDEDDRERLDAEIDSLRARKRQLEETVSDLQDVVGFNEGMLDGEDGAVGAALCEESEGGAVTDQLVADDTTVCWTCGSTVDTERIEATLDRLRELRRERLAEVREVEDELEALTTEREAYADRERRRAELEARLEELEAELEDRRGTVEELREERDRLGEAVESLEREVESLETEDFEEVLTLHREANQLEFDLESLESDHEEVTDRIASVEERLEEESDLEARREELSERLTDLRTRIERIETEAVDGFNEHMDAVLDILDYENLDRIWIERVERTVREGRRKVETTQFDLHVVRSTAAGVTYEDTVGHLSESEREVTGLVFALAGYLVHEVYETVPFMLLDSLEAIDAPRIAALVDYVAEYADYLTVALLPEDAQALDDDYARITEI
jgi:DNA repair exonuclease SbcCD ATPase subunit